MHLNQLLLSVAVPVAARSVGIAARTIQDFGSSFAQMLHSAPVQPQTDSPQSIESRFAMLAKRIRSEIAAGGTSLPFRLRVEAAPGQPAEVTVSGPAAEEVTRWLRQQPEVAEELVAVARELASALSASDHSAPARIVAEVSDRSAHYWASR